MPTILADLSRYDPDEAADDYEGVILNLEDPGLAHKAEIAHAAGVPIILYSWVYPGDNGHSATRAFAAVEMLAAVGIPVARNYVFWDYEQGGVSPDDLAAALALSDQRGTESGIYTYAFMVGSVAHLLPGRDLWLAYYPRGNDGSYPVGEEYLALNWGAVLWQYTSSNGTRDLSAVLNQAWWDHIRATGHAPTPPPKEDLDMQTMVFTTRADGKTFCYWRHGAQLLMRGFTSGAPDEEVLVVSDDCDPTNLHIDLSTFGVIRTPSASGRFVQVTGTDLGPVSKVV